MKGSCWLLLLTFASEKRQKIARHLVPTTNQLSTHCCAKHTTTTLHTMYWVLGFFPKSGSCDTQTIVEFLGIHGAIPTETVVNTHANQ
uniref:Putative secreted peptide n=1 Tax=Anopheles braziliensis TaxID=58242 RepID=A0A2M3ZVC3_9DIPT